MKGVRHIAFTGFVAAALLALSAGHAAAQWQIDSKDGKSNIKVGFLAQPQFEAIDTSDATATSKNVYLRRIRLVFGGKIAEKWTFFFETDNPNVGKATASNGVKDTGNMYIQDAYFTYNQSDTFKVDAGMIMIPLGHNHNQSAATLLPVDYGAYSFTESTPLGSRVGRDYGLQLRGYPLKQHLEYRLGVFSGSRGPNATNDLRVAGRAVWYPFAADTGFFYSGTFHGSKKVVALGAGFDAQKDYRSYAADAFVELPLNKGKQGITAQFNWMRFDGGTFIGTGLPRQDTYEAEAGVHLLKGKLSPLVQYSRKTFQNSLTPQQWVWQAGVAYWISGHQRNIKITAGRQHTDGLPDRTQVLAQLQLFCF